MASKSLKKKYQYKESEIEIGVLLGYDAQFHTKYANDSDTPILIHSVHGSVAGVVVYKKLNALSSNLHEEVTIAERECQRYVSVASDIADLIRMLTANGFE